MAQANKDGNGNKLTIPEEPHSTEESFQFHGRAADQGCSRVNSASNRLWQACIVAFFF